MTANRQTGNQQIRQAINQHIGDIPRVLNRQQCMEFAVMLAANLERLLNSDQRLPWVTASITQRSDGFTLDVQVVSPTDETDTQVVA
jgi:hypothetical protein